MEPIKGEYKTEIHTYTNKHKLYLNKITMETKKKIDWAKIWTIIKNILIALLTAETAARTIS